MSWILLVILPPLFGTPLIFFVKRVELAAVANIIINALAFAGSIGLAREVLLKGSVGIYGGFFYLDAFNVFLVTLTCFVATTTSIFSRSYMSNELASGKLTVLRLRLYHSMYNLFVFGMILGFVANNIGVIWVAMELATLATVLLVSLYRTPASLRAAWKYFILAGMGIALALFGTVLIFFTSSTILGYGNEALTWTLLYQNASELDPRVMMVAFAFLMVGYGTKIGVAPMHTWLPDAHGEGPTPVSAVLSGLLLNLALYALVRLKMLVDGATKSDTAGHIMIAFGLFSLILSAFSLHRQKDIKRLYSFSSVEHMGLITLAFGIGTPVAVFAGLLHITVHSLVKSGIFFTAGHAAQAMGTQKMGEIRGLIRHNPGIGWGLLIGTAAIAGFPPFGIFTSEFLLFTVLLRNYPWLVIILLAGLLIASAGLFRFVQPMVFGAPPRFAKNISVNMFPVYLHLAFSLVLGLFIPGFLAGWYENASRLIGMGR